MNLELCSCSEMTFGICDSLHYRLSEYVRMLEGDLHLFRCGLKNVLDGICIPGLDSYSGYSQVTNFYIISVIHIHSIDSFNTVISKYMHFRSVCGMFLSPSMVAPVFAWNLISCTNNQVLITLSGFF